MKYMMPRRYSAAIFTRTRGGSPPRAPPAAATGHLFYQGLAAMIFLAQARVFPSRRGARILLALATTAYAANVAVYAVLGFPAAGHRKRARLRR